MAQQGRAVQGCVTRSECGMSTMGSHSLASRTAGRARRNLKESGTSQEAQGGRMEWLDLKDATLQRLGVRGGTRPGLLAEF